MHFIYWIHLDLHTDPFTLGYIGVTSDLHTRTKSHISALENGRHSSIGLQEAFDNIRSKLKISTLLYDDKDSCYEYEYILRSNPNIGWNNSPGGFGNLKSYENSTRKLVNIDLLETREFRVIPKIRRGVLA